MTADSTVRVISPYFSNIDPAVISGQKKVFDSLGIPLDQVLVEDERHDVWLDRIAQASADEIQVFCDIDAFPMQRDAFDNALNQARSGRIVGLAQCSASKSPEHIYAGPMFLAFRTDVFHDLGAPTLRVSKACDTAQNLTRRAEQRGVEVAPIYPNACIVPRWNLGNWGVFGIGTFYGDNGFFHLFQSRLKENLKLFEAVASDTAAGRLDFANYLRVMGIEPDASREKKVARPQRDG